MYVPTLQGKLHETLEEHLGQLAAEIRSVREQFKRVYLSKRKREDEGEFKQVSTIMFAKFCFSMLVQAGASPASHMSVVQLAIAVLNDH